MRHLRVDLGRLLQQLQALGELPLRGDQAAVARQPGFAALAGQLVDPVGLALGGVVAPQLHVGVRLAGELRQLAQRGAVGGGRHHRAGGEVGGDADDRGRVDAGGRRARRDGGAQHVDVVGGDLQGPLRGQRAAVGQRSVEHAVRVVVTRGAELGAVGHPDHDGAAGQGAEVHADDERGGWRTLLALHLRPSRAAADVLAGAERPPPGQGGADTLPRTTSVAAAIICAVLGTPRARRAASSSARPAWATASKSGRTVVSGGMR